MFLSKKVITIKYSKESQYIFAMTDLGKSCDNVKQVIEHFAILQDNWNSIEGLQEKPYIIDTPTAC